MATKKKANDAAKKKKKKRHLGRRNRRRRRQSRRAAGKKKAAEKRSPRRKRRRQAKPAAPAASTCDKHGDDASNAAHRAATPGARTALNPAAAWSVSDRIPAVTGTRSEMWRGRKSLAGPSSQADRPCSIPAHRSSGVGRAAMSQPKQRTGVFCPPGVSISRHFARDPTACRDSRAA